MNSNLYGAIRGPILLITVGVLFALDHNGGYGFRQSWPLLLVVAGILKLLERVTVSVPPPPPPPPPSSSAFGNPIQGGN